MNVFMFAVLIALPLSAWSFGFENNGKYNTEWKCEGRAGAQVKSNRKSGKLEATIIKSKKNRRSLRVELYVYKNGTTGNGIKVHYPDGENAVFNEFMERTYLHKRKSKITEIWRVHQGTWTEQGKKKQLLTITSNLIFPQSNVNLSLIFGHMSLYECEWARYAGK